MECVLANLETKIRHERLNGRDYLVAPATLIVPGVLNGSKGALYYPPEEVARDYHAWNGMPLVLGHPVKNGEHVSARDPDVLEQYGLGQVFAANYGDKLVAEAWFDIGKTLTLDRKNNTDILGNLRRGKPIELSTGLYTDNEPAENGASHKGRPYAWVARNYRPDHLAVLVDQKGACSLDDGCGINVNESEDSIPWGELGTLLGVANAESDDCDEWVTMSGAPVCIKGSEVASGPLKGKESTAADGGKGGGEGLDKGQKEFLDKFEEAGGKLPKAISERLEKSGSLDKGQREFLRQFKAAGGKVPKAVQKRLTGNEEKRSLLGKLASLLGFSINAQPRSGNTGKYKDMNAGYGRGDVHEAAQRGAMVLTDSQRDRGRDAKLQAAEGHNPPSWVDDEATWERAKEAADKGGYDADTYYAVVTHIYENMGGDIAGNSASADPDDNSAARDTHTEEADMAMNDKQRGETIDFLVTNCECFKGKDKVLANKEAFSDDDLVALKRHIEQEQADRMVANAARKGFVDKRSKAQFVFNSERGGFIRNAFPPAKEAAADDEVICAEDDEECKAGMAENKMPGFIKDKIEKREAAANAVRPMTPDEWFAQAPPEIQEAHKYAQAAMNERKAELANRLTANVREEAKRQQLFKKLMGLSLNDLQERLELMPPAPRPQLRAQEDFGTNYYGYAPTINRNPYGLTQEESEDVLDLEGEREKFEATLNKDREELGALLRGDKRRVAVR